MMPVDGTDSSIHIITSDRENSQDLAMMVSMQLPGRNHKYTFDNIACKRITDPSARILQLLFFLSILDHRTFLPWYPELVDLIGSIAGISRSGSQENTDDSIYRLYAQKIRSIRSVIGLTIVILQSTAATSPE